MKAICRNEKLELETRDVPTPERAERFHILVKMSYCAINHGDKTFLKNVLAPEASAGMAISKYDIWGVSGVGQVIEIGEDVPEVYRGKYVSIYRSLTVSDHIVGMWSEVAHVPIRDVALLREDLSPIDYSGSLVNVITPYAFLKEIISDGHKGLVCTAGASATGIAMLGLCVAQNIPIISIVRNEFERAELEKLGAENIVVRSNSDFRNHLSSLSGKLEATAVFDGVGGEILNEILGVLPLYSTVFCYGYLGSKPLEINTSLISARGLTIRGFRNTKTSTVQDLEQLGAALQKISEFIHMPHFKTKIGKIFTFDQIDEAWSYAGENGEKAILKV